MFLFFRVKIVLFSHRKTVIVVVIFVAMGGMSFYFHEKRVGFSGVIFSRSRDFPLQTEFICCFLIFVFKLTA